MSTFDFYNKYVFVLAIHVEITKRHPISSKSPNLFSSVLIHPTEILGNLQNSFGFLCRMPATYRTEFDQNTFIDLTTRLLIYMLFLNFKYTLLLILRCVFFTTNREIFPISRVRPSRTPVLLENEWLHQVVQTVRKFKQKSNPEPLWSKHKNYK